MSSWIPPPGFLFSLPLFFLCQENPEADFFADYFSVGENGIGRRPECEKICRLDRVWEQMAGAEVEAAVGQLQHPDIGREVWRNDWPEAAAQGLWPVETRGPAAGKKYKAEMQGL